MKRGLIAQCILGEGGAKSEQVAENQTKGGYHVIGSGIWSWFNRQGVNTESSSPPRFVSTYFSESLVRPTPQLWDTFDT